MERFINLEVSGLYFCLSVADIQRFPDSYFAHLIKDEWNADTSAPVQINRDGLLFRHIHHYLCTVDSGYEGNVCTLDFEMLLAVKSEADFYNLEKLVKHCDTQIASQLSTLTAREHDTTDSSHMNNVVAECESGAIDQLVESMSFVRHPCIATARLAFSSANIIRKVTGERLATFLLWFGHTYSPGASYKQLGSHLIAPGVLHQLKRQLTWWPLYDKGAANIRDCKVMAFSEADIYKRRVQENNPGERGCFVYILHAAIAGGSVTASVNGYAVTINQQGECLALAPGVAYCVDRVQSGALIILEYIAHEPNLINGTSLEPLSVDWTLHNNGATSMRHMHTLDTIWTKDLISRIQDSLRTYDSVALCLSGYYDVSHIYPNGKFFATDLDKLNGNDKFVYDALLSAEFDISAVCVSTTKASTDPATVQAEVLRLQNNIMNQCDAVEQKCKIVCPLFGMGHKFRFTNSKVDGDTSIVWGTLLTALLITFKA